MSLNNNALLRKPVANVLIILFGLVRVQVNFQFHYISCSLLKVTFPAAGSRNFLTCRWLHIPFTIDTLQNI